MVTECDRYSDYIDRRAFIKGLSAITAALAVPGFLSGCGILKSKHPDPRTLVDKLGIPARFRDKAILVRQATEFGNSVLGLESGENFTRYDKDHMNYLLFACDPLKLAPNYDTPGVSYYEVYDDRENFLRRRQEFIDKGYDVRTRTGMVATAQFTDGFLGGDLDDILRTALHENTHQTVELAYQLEEPIAHVTSVYGLEMFVHRELDNYLGERILESVRENERYFLARREIAIETHKRLSDVYNSSLPLEEKLRRKKGIFDDFKRDIAAKQKEVFGSAFPIEDVNNAMITDLITYSAHNDDVEKVVKKYGLIGSVKIFKHAPRGFDKGYAFLRRLL
jgi:hypothetical protein